MNGCLSEFIRRFHAASSAAQLILEAVPFSACIIARDLLSRLQR